MSNIPDEQFQSIPCVYYSICGSRTNVYKIHYVKYIDVMDDALPANSEYYTAAQIQQQMQTPILLSAAGQPTWTPIDDFLDGQNVDMDTGFSTNEEMRDELNNEVTFGQSHQAHHFENELGYHGINYVTQLIEAPNGCVEAEMTDFFNPFLYVVLEGSDETLFFAPNETIQNDGRTEFSFDFPVPISGVGDAERGVYTLVTNHVNPDLFGNDFSNYTIEILEDSPRDTGLVFGYTNNSPEEGFSSFSSQYGGSLDASQSEDGLNLPSFNNKNPLGGDVPIGTEPNRYFKFQVNNREVEGAEDSLLGFFDTSMSATDPTFVAGALTNGESFVNETAALGPVLYGKRIAEGDLSALPPPPSDNTFVPEPEKIRQGVISESTEESSDQSGGSDAPDAVEPSESTPTPAPRPRVKSELELASKYKKSKYIKK